MNFKYIFLLLALVLNVSYVHGVTIDRGVYNVELSAQVKGPNHSNSCNNFFNIVAYDSFNTNLWSWYQDIREPDNSLKAFSTTRSYSTERVFNRFTLETRRQWKPILGSCTSANGSGTQTYSFSVDGPTKRQSFNIHAWERDITAGLTIYVYPQRIEIKSDNNALPSRDKIKLFATPGYHNST